MSITCTCVALPAAACAYPKTCAFFNRLDGYEFTDCSSVVDGREKRSLRSVGALIFPDADWATAFHIGNNWILTAGHVFADPIPDEAWPCADAKSADSYIVMFDHEAGMDPIARTKCVLDPLHATALDVKFHRVRDNHLDYSLCKVLSTTELNHTHPAPELAKNLPVADDKVYLIHHAIQGRAKQLIAGKCRFVDGQRIYVDFQADLGASGGLLLNEKWEAIGVMVDGQSTFPFAYSLLTILRDIGAPLRALVGVSEEMVVGAEPRRTDLTTPSPEAKKPRRPSDSKSISKHQNNLPNAVETGRDSVCKVYAAGNDLAWSRQGTGFVVAKGWVLTAHHVASCLEEAVNLKFDFNYDKKDKPGHPKPECKTKENGGYYCSRDGLLSCDGAHYSLDYALIEVEPSNKIYSLGPPIKLTNGLPAADDEIFIIQHAAIPDLQHKGVLKQKDIGGNWLPNSFKDADREHVYHLAARAGGASGGPILNAQGRAFGMHTHEPYFYTDKPQQTTYNWGTRLSAVARDLLERNPTIIGDHPELLQFLNLGQT